MPTPRQQQLRQLFTEMLTAYGNMEFERFARYLAEDTVFEWPYRPLADFPARMVGVAPFIETSKAGMADTGPYNHRIDTLYDMADPDLLIAEYHTATRLKSSGKPYGNHYVGILRYQGEKVVFWKEYLNPLAVLDAFGAGFANDTANSAIS